ncbi:organic cation/carnitine transporter 2-like [Haemaphysalis longicornis]
MESALAPKGPRLPSADLGHGRFQLMILACAQLSVAVDAYQALCSRLLTPPVDHWCRPPPEFAHMNPDLWRNVALPLGSDGRFNQCAVYEQLSPSVREYETDTERRARLCNEWNYELPRGVQTMASRWNLVCDYAWHVTLVEVFNIICGLVMLPLAGQLSDKTGRRTIAICCVVLAMCAALALAYANSLAVFAVSRAFVGASVSSLRVNTIVLLFEVTTKCFRVFYCCLAQAGLLLGSLAATTLEGAGVLDMRVVAIIGIMPTLLLVFCFHALEESPVWHLSMWKFDEAKDVLISMSRANGITVIMNVPVLERQFDIRRKEEVPALRSSCVLDMLTNEVLRGRVVRAFCVWFCLFFSMHAVWQHTPRHTNVWLLLTAVVPRAAALPAAYALMRTFSRKQALAMCVALSCCLAFGLAFVLLLSPPSSKVLLTLLCELTLASLGMTYTVVIIHSLELFPTMLRTMAVCTLLSCGRIGAAVATAIALPAQRLHSSAPLFLVTLSLLIAQVALISLPETKHGTLLHTLYDLEVDVIKQTVMDILQECSFVGLREDYP